MEGQTTREKDKLYAIKVVTECAEKYKQHLQGRRLLFIYKTGQKTVSTCEMVFSTGNFLHLTGLRISNRKMGAKDFYHKCLKKHLSIHDFEFDKNGTTPLKLKVLPQLICKNLSAKMIGDFDTNNPKLWTEKVAGTTSACMGFVKKENNCEQYAPNTVLNGDTRDYVKNAQQVIAVYRKHENDEKYGEMTYCAKGIQWDQIDFPEPYGYLQKPVVHNKEKE